MLRVSKSSEEWAKPRLCSERCRHVVEGFKETEDGLIFVWCEKERDPAVVDVSTKVDRRWNGMDGACKEIW